MIVVACATTMVAAALAFTPAVAAGQTIAPGAAAAMPIPDAERPNRPLTFEEFLAAVLRSNPDYLAERPAVEVAAAERRAAGLRPDPEISAGFARDPDGEPGSYSLGVSQAIPLGGKRRARLAVADHGLAAARAELDDFTRSLMASATEVYIDAAITGQIYQRQLQSVATLERLVAINQERVRVGDLGELDLLQSRVELRQLQNELLAITAERQEALLELARFMGRHQADTLFTPVALPDGGGEELRLDELLASARERPDLIAARREADAARAGIRLARAELLGDIELGFGMQRSRTIPGLATPRWGGAEFSVSLPIPFMNVANRGELIGARWSADQAELLLRAAAARAEAEVRSAFARHRLARDRAGQYSAELLADAEKVLAGRLYSYERGNEPLIEVLLAQRAADEVYLGYFEAAAEALKALAALREAAGLPQEFAGGGTEIGKEVLR
jgi:cobalt-zinc-cadmium efflux system outer membrane protein